MANETRAPRVFDVKDGTPAKETPAKEKPKVDSLANEGGTRPKWARDLKEELESNYQMIGTVLGVAAKTQFQSMAAQNFIESSGAAADAWVDVAEKNPKIKAALLKFTSGTAMAQVVSVHVTMLLPVLSGYGVVPENAGAMILMAQMSDEQKAAMYQAQQAAAAAEAAAANGGSTQ